MSRTARKTALESTEVRAVLYPAVTEAARRVSANAIGLIDVGCGAGFDLTVDRVGITYRNGHLLGDPHSPVQVSSAVVGRHAVPMFDPARRSRRPLLVPRPNAELADGLLNQPTTTWPGRMWRITRSTPRRSAYG